jgi:hypothetical protein
MSVAEQVEIPAFAGIHNCVSQHKNPAFAGIHGVHHG